MAAVPAPRSLHTAPQRIAVVGGGWAGMAAAVSLVQRGHHVSLWETARHWGGRARALAVQDLQGRPLTVDNGQHILIGAYTDSLALMRTVGVDVEQALLRLPLDLRDGHGHGLQLPDLPPPWDAALGIARARGWSWRDKYALLARAARWKRSHFRCNAHATVADLCQGLPQRLLQDFIDPLCISALNLPAAQASGVVFLRVLHDSLFAGRGGSNLLLPRTDLGTLFPGSAARWLAAHGATLHLGQRVHSLQPRGRDAQSGWLVDGEPFDGVLLATTSAEAARLALTGAAALHDTRSACEHWAGLADALPYTAIATVYAQCPAGSGLPAPMVALRSGPDAPAQFAFDRGRLGGPAGLIALVISASDALPLDRATLQAQTLAQARQQLDLPGLVALRTVVEKRATFACTPDVQRPAAHVAPRLWACGDYVEGPYPATLEGAVRSGLEVAQAF